MRQNLIELKDAYLIYGNNSVLNNINFVLREGESTAILANPGGGLSSFLKICAGITIPTKGTAFLMGVNTRSGIKKMLMQIKSSVGFFFEDNALFSTMNMYDNLAFYFRVNTDFTEEDIKTIIESHIRRFYMFSDVDNTIAAQLSNQKKSVINFLRATMHKPDILFLDGLFDIKNSYVTKLLLSELDVYVKETPHSTLLFTSSSFRYVDGYVKRVVVLSKGDIYFDGDVDRFKNEALKDAFLGEFLQVY